MAYTPIKHIPLPATSKGHKPWLLTLYVRYVSLTAYRVTFHWHFRLKLVFFYFLAKNNAHVINLYNTSHLIKVWHKLYVCPWKWRVASKGEGIVIFNGFRLIKYIIKFQITYERSLITNNVDGRWGVVGRWGPG